MVMKFGLRPLTTRFDRTAEMPSLRLKPEDWQALGSACPNVMLVGQPDATYAALRVLHPTFRRPLSVCRAVRPLELPPPREASGTLLIEEVGQLAPEDQRCLHDWSREVHGTVQIVTTSLAPLLPLVERGAFLDALYYRLNLVYLDLVALPGAAGGPHDVGEYEVL